MIPASRLPGVTFETVTPPRDEVLPRMDVAAFVGLASSGPLHTPVPVEDLGRFRDLFGRDPELAWDPARGRMAGSYLGPAVAAFLRNGGQRCWVVRVADRQRAHRYRFRLPGLSRHPSLGTALELRPATARARSAGSWPEGGPNGRSRPSERLRVGTLLERQTLLPARPTLAATEAFAVDEVSPRPRYRLDLEALTGDATAGDLVEIAFGASGPRLYLFIDHASRRAAGLRLLGSVGWWLLPLIDDSPPMEASADADEAEARWAAVAPAAGIDRWRQWRDDGSAGLSIRRLSFELLAWRGSALWRRLAGLTFHPDHSRFWGRLPTDRDLFALPQGRQVPLRPAAVEALRSEASDPRFPFAGPEDDGTAYHLPFEADDAGRLSIMATRPDPELARSPATAAGTPLERDGLASFGPHLFVDPDLATTGSRALLGEAEHKYYLRQQQLSGFHSLLPVTEATLVAVPDALQPGWTRGVPPLPAPLAAPVLEDVELDRTGRYRLVWSAVAEAERYRLQGDDRIHFPRPEAAYDGPRLTVRITPPEGCPVSRYFRVRAERHEAVSPWSNTRAAPLPRPDFTACDDHALNAPELRLTADRRLAWAAVDGADRYRLETAADPGFVAARELYFGTATSFEPPLEPDVIAFYRVRAERGETLGPWSTTVHRRPAARRAWTLLADSGEATDLLQIQQALLRFCAARGDLFALLSLPRRYRRERILRHLAALGRERALSFGGLYHPWIAATAGATPTAAGPVTEIRFTPPEGTVAGTAAQLARDQGAWLAPANVPLAGVVALDPDLGLEEERRLSAARVNLVRRDPHGFVVQGADTLSAEEPRSIPVRRLLILLRRLALREGVGYVFEPHDADFRGQVRHRFERLLSDLYVRGAFAGADADAAFRVVADASVNTASSLERGRFIVELRVAPSRPMTFLTVRLVQTGPEQLVLQEL